MGKKYANKAPLQSPQMRKTRRTALLYRHKMAELTLTLAQRTLTLQV